MKNPWKALPEGARDVIVVALVAAVVVLLTLSVTGCAAGRPVEQVITDAGGTETTETQIPYYLWLPWFGWLFLWTAAPVIVTPETPTLLGMVGGFVAGNWPWLGPAFAMLFPKVQNNVAAAVLPGSGAKPLERVSALVTAAFPLLNSPPAARAIEAKRKARKRTPKPAEPPAAGA